LKTIQLKSLAFSLQVQELELENERIKRDIERKTEQKRIAPCTFQRLTDKSKDSATISAYIARGYACFESKASLSAKYCCKRNKELYSSV
jgi:hypothetical protein